ncbi:hypothetical protein [Ferrimonas sp.]|uniref:hypothetical protein n=1 Tax=Ferrimonas sp. TaxID=2080861 RepID=UPI003A902AE8
MHLDSLIEAAFNTKSLEEMDLLGRALAALNWSDKVNGDFLGLCMVYCESSEYCAVAQEVCRQINDALAANPDSEPDVDVLWMLTTQSTLTRTLH